MDKKVITRFAPSPTGFLHIGSARTALFNYLFAKHYNGLFRLRIEDTDQKRSTTAALDAIISGLEWLDIKWDEEIIFQSKRNELYQEAAFKLLKEDKAYYCYASQEEIEQQRQEAIKNKKPFIFRSPWRDNIKAPLYNQQPVIRLRAPQQGSTIIHDNLQGDVVIENSYIDDMVLLRSDGSATYMIAVVVDDHDMGITHIIRGDDHLTNAARQMAIYQAFGWNIPSMTHIPLIHGSDGSKLSKRHGALSVLAYKEMGYLPETLCNYLLRLGWAHGNDEIISRQQAIELFTIKGLGKSPAKLDFAKMNNLNAHYLRNLSTDNLIATIIEFLHPRQITNKELERIKTALPSLLIRSETFLDLINLAKIYLTDFPLVYSDEAQKVIHECDSNLLNQVVKTLNEIENFHKSEIQAKFKELAIANNMKLNELMLPIRSLMTGFTNSPGIFEMAEILGKQDTIERIKGKKKI